MANAYGSPLSSLGFGTRISYMMRNLGTDAGPDAGSRRGGRCEARPHSRPYMAYLERPCGASYTHCGGFLVSENFVLTAAHCQGDEITVVLGAHNITKQEPSQQRIRVRRQIPHPQYNRDTLENDIMLLQESVELDGCVTTIFVPETDEWMDPGGTCSVAGWGRTIAQNSSSGVDALQEVDVEVLEDDKCSGYDYYDLTTMLCVEHPQKGGDSAQGNSSGPLVCDGKVQGIASWGSLPGKIPGTYTGVSTFVDWIWNEMGWPQP